MAQAHSTCQGAEVEGTALILTLDGMGAFRQSAVKVLESHGITEPEPGQWYPLQSWIDTLEEIGQKTGPNTLKLAGRRSAEAIQRQPGIDSVEKALAGMDIAYQRFHRGPNIGHYTLKKVDEQTFALVCDDLYPCPFTTGLVDTIVAKLAPASVSIQVKHDETAACKTTGGHSCTYLISWRSDPAAATASAASATTP